MAGPMKENMFENKTATKTVSIQIQSHIHPTLVFEAYWFKAFEWAWQISKVLPQNLEDTTVPEEGFAKPQAMCPEEANWSGLLRDVQYQTSH